MIGSMLTQQKYLESMMVVAAALAALAILIEMPACEVQPYSNYPSVTALTYICSVVCFRVRFSAPVPKASIITATMLTSIFLIAVNA